MRLAILFICGWMLLVVPEFLRVYLIMPFPGSQVSNTIDVAYFLHRYILIFREAGLLLILYPLYHYFFQGTTKQKIISGIFTVIAAIIFYLAVYVMEADKIFLQPEQKIFAGVADNKVNLNSLVIGVDLDSAAKAYPIEFIGYHHHILDTVGETPILVTYCTVCRSGRVFSPLINGELQHFRLVGMDHFNAMLEDERTTSWWRQENGEAIAGPMKGRSLDEISSEQVTLKAWINEHPQTLIMQPDPKFTADYNDLTGFDKGSIRGGLIGTDTNSWQPYSWVIGIVLGDEARAYDWNELKKKRVINDTLNEIPLSLFLENDTASFHAWDRNVGDETLQFVWNDSLKMLKDLNSNSSWNNEGQCVDGKMEGTQLITIQSYQEFWHSWQTFHPNSTKYREQIH